jgi:hypothetical protein
MNASNAAPLRQTASEGGCDHLLFYAVEIWADDMSAPEQLLAQASSVVLARAIFTAAMDEHPGRRIVLRHGERVVDKT